MTAAERRDWSGVLAECEATAAAAEQLLRSRSQFDPDAFAQLTELDLWRLDLGPLPTELLERAQDVHRRQVALAADLVDAMASVQLQIDMTSSTTQLRKTSRFVDRTA
jgi:hypothetical protein